MTVEAEVVADLGDRAGIALAPLDDGRLFAVEQYHGIRVVKDGELRTPDLMQGALVRHGRGRVAVFGEAAMFSAQLSGPEERPMGMNHPSAAQNYRFALNVLRWLSEPVR